MEKVATWFLRSDDIEATKGAMIPPVALTNIPKKVPKNPKIANLFRVEPNWPIVGIHVKIIIMIPNNPCKIAVGRETKIWAPAKTPIIAPIKKGGIKFLIRYRQSKNVLLRLPPSWTTV